MKTHILICSMLICMTAGFPTRDDLYVDGLSSQEVEEYLLQPRFVFDDNDELIHLDLEADFPETLAETQKDLPNRVFFYLYTRKNPTEYQQIRPHRSDLLKASNFEPDKPTRFVIHGWMNSHKSDACKLPRTAFLENGDYNVIVVDWSSISFRPYIWTSNRVKMVADYVATMIDFLQENGSDPSKMMLAGHSLGAHIAGLAARKSRGTVNYVVGLDPALPNFWKAGPGERIATGDANYVEIIHTNAGLLGFLSAIGDVDYYPNGGTKQAGCVIDAGGACSHARAFKFFAESLNTRIGFYAKQCSNYRDYNRNRCNSDLFSCMGGNKAKIDYRGTFYLKTNRKYPYAMGQ